MRKAVAIPHTISLILGVVVLVIIGYWFVTQSGKTIKVGSGAECDTMKFNYCKGATWDTKCGPEATGVCCGNGVVDIVRGEQCELGQNSETICGVLTGVGVLYEACGSNCRWAGCP